MAAPGLPAANRYDTDGTNRLAQKGATPIVNNMFVPSDFVLNGHAKEAQATSTGGYSDAARLISRSRAPLGVCSCCASGDTTAVTVHARFCLSAGRLAGFVHPRPAPEHARLLRKRLSRSDLFILGTPSSQSEAPVCHLRTPPGSMFVRLVSPSSSTFGLPRPPPCNPLAVIRSTPVAWHLGQLAGPVCSSFQPP